MSVIGLLVVKWDAALTKSWCRVAALSPFILADPWVQKCFLRGPPDTTLFSLWRNNIFKTWHDVEILISDSESVNWNYLWMITFTLTNTENLLTSDHAKWSHNLRTTCLRIFAEHHSSSDSRFETSVIGQHRPKFDVPPTNSNVARSHYNFLRYRLCIANAITFFTETLFFELFVS